MLESLEQKRAWILHANSRYIHGNWMFSSPSRFISELPKKNIILSNLFLITVMTIIQRNN